MQKAIVAAKEGKVKEVEQGWIIERMEDIVIRDEEIDIRWQPKLEFKNFAVDTDESIVVALDTKITPELELEGKARDLVRIIQDLRKQAGYEVSDRIELQLENADEVLKSHEQYIAAETLAEKVSQKLDSPDAADSLEEIKIGVKKL